MGNNCRTETGATDEISSIRVDAETAFRIDTFLGYVSARTSIINTIEKFERDEASSGDYPSGMERTQEVFPDNSNGTINKTVHIAILYNDCVGNGSQNHWLVLSLVSGPNGDAILLVPQTNEFFEENPGDFLPRHPVTKDLSIVRRKVEAPPSPKPNATQLKFV